MDLGVAVVTGIFGSAGLFSLIQFLISRYDKKNQGIAQIKQQLDKIEHKCSRNELAITRLQLIYLIDVDPENKDAILQTAQRYFVELDGNGEAWAFFDRWAKEEKLDIGWYKALLERKEKHDKRN